MGKMRKPMKIKKYMAFSQEMRNADMEDIEDIDITLSNDFMNALTVGNSIENTNRIGEDADQYSGLKKNENAFQQKSHSYEYPGSKERTSSAQEPTRFQEHKQRMTPPLEIPVPAFISSGSPLPDSCADDQSLSSLDSCEDSRGNRPIFGNYWKSSIEEEGAQLKQGMSIGTANTNSITMSSRCTQEAIMQLPDEFAYQEFKRDFQAHTNKNTSTDYEELIKENEIGRTTRPRSASIKDITTEATSTMPKVARNKRIIFKNKYASSSPTLSSYGYIDTTNVSVRKTSSTSSLRSSSLRKTKRSCLRSRSLSVDSTALGSLQSSSSRLSVSFDDRVFIHEYEKPHERYTTNGWSKHFV
jgi:hypothetical protein